MDLCEQRAACISPSCQSWYNTQRNSNRLLILLKLCFREVQISCTWKKSAEDRLDVRTIDTIWHRQKYYFLLQLLHQGTSILRLFGCSSTKYEVPNELIQPNGLMSLAHQSVSHSWGSHEGPHVAHYSRLKLKKHRRRATTVTWRKSIPTPFIGASLRPGRVI